MKAIMMGLALGLGLAAMAGPARSCETDPCIETPVRAVVVRAHGDCDTDPCIEGAVPAAATVAPARGDCEGSDCRGPRVQPWREGLRHLRHGG